MNDQAISRHLAKNKYFICILIFASLALAGSLIFQFAMGFRPCALCKAQRYLVLACGIVACVSYLRSSHKTGFLLTQVLLMTAASFALYHLCVQMHWLSDPCAVPKAVDSIDSFRSLLAKPTPCASNSIAVFGLPPSAINLVMTAALFALGLAKHPIGRRQGFTVF